MDRRWLEPVTKESLQPAGRFRPSHCRPRHAIDHPNAKEPVSAQQPNLNREYVFEESADVVYSGGFKDPMRWALAFALTPCLVCAQSAKEYYTAGLAEAKAAKPIEAVRQLQKAVHSAPGNRTYEEALDAQKPLAVRMLIDASALLHSVGRQREAEDALLNAMNIDDREAPALLTLLRRINPSAVGPLVYRWRKGYQNCSYQIVQGELIQTITGTSAAVSVSLRQTAEVTRIDAVVLNGSAAVIELHPEDFLLDVLEPTPQPLLYRAPESIEKAIQRNAKHKAMWIALFAALATTHTQTSTTGSGSYSGMGPGGFSSGTFNTAASSITTQPDYLARARAYQLQDRVMEYAQDAVASIEREALKVNTLVPGQSIGGTVYFQPAKGAQTYLLVLPVGRDKYQFVVPVNP